MLFPSSIGRPEAVDELRAVLTAAAEGQKGVKVLALEMNAQIEGKRLTRLVLENPSGVREYWIDLTRGAIPVRMEDRIGSRPPTILVQDDLMQTGGGWLPRRQLLFFAGGRVKDVTLEDVDFSKRPSADAFRLAFPKPVPVLDTTRLLRHDPRTGWDLACLPTRASSKSKVIVVAPAREPEPARPGPGRDEN